MQCLDVRKSKLGPDHPDTLNSMINLAILYYNQGSHKYLNNIQKYCAIYETKHYYFIILSKNLHIYHLSCISDYLIIRFFIAINISVHININDMSCNVCLLSFCFVM